jgi:hypothetical protein
MEMSAPPECRSPTRYDATAVRPMNSSVYFNEFRTTHHPAGNENLVAQSPVALPETQIEFRDHLQEFHEHK